jgi:hypothetical protein
VKDTTEQVNNNVNKHALSYKQLEVKTNRTSFYAEIVTEITILDIYDCITITAGGLLVPEAMINIVISVTISA